MKLSEAQKLDAEGRLPRKVMTEKGWYIPIKFGASPPLPEPELPAGVRRNPARTRKDII